jgi:glycerophosphoryl diester phosphodiesterase
MTSKQIDVFLSKQSATRLQREPAFSSLLALAPETYERLPDPYDAKGEVEARVRSYLHSNCAQCHVEAGGGNAQMQLEFKTKLIKANIVNQKPLHHPFEMQDPRLVTPGHPERSVLLHRMSNRGAGHMPPLATSVVDRDAVELIRRWIADMPVTAALPIEQTVAHRGSSADRPENTLAGFRRAFEVGATATEMDVRTTKDQQLVLSHDADLKRTTNGTGLIADKTLAELKQLDAGSWFDPKFKHERMATLKEALKVCHGKIDVLLDLKEQGEEYANAVVAEVRKYGEPKRTIVGVRSVEQARLFRKLLPEARQIGLIPTPEDIDAFVAAGVETIRLWPKWLSDETLVAKVRKAGVKLHFSGATGEPDEVLPLLKHQPDSISSDNPAVLIKTLSEAQVVGM